MNKYQHSNIDDPIIEFITTKLNDNLDEWFGARCGLTLMAPVFLTYNNCFMMRFPLSGQNGVEKNILVKIRRHPKMQSLNQAVSKKELHSKIPAEYKDLELLYKFYKDYNKNLGAIRPLIYLDKYYAIVMEEFKSQTLREILMDWKTILGFENNINYLLNVAQLTGLWLNSFHGQLHECHEIEGSIQPIVNEIVELFDRLKAASRQQNLANSLQAGFLQKTTSIESKNIPYSETHGDMTCDNVLYSSENMVCIIDVKTKRAPIYSDLGLIMIHPDTFMLQIFGFGLFFRRQNIQAYRAAILKGYFGNQNADNTLINLYCAIKMLDKWVMYEEIMFKSTGRKYLLSIVAAPLLRAYFKPRIKKYLDSI
ncbi:MAG: hypothetical protein HY863_12470 [Chloroflexi bacterium]|nr:hypothetical protein [Chloroflexota bacterium]